MQLSSRILTAFAVLILAVSVLAIGVVSRDGTIGAATGTIDVLNVGTCYTTNDDVFDVGACDDGTGTEGYNVAGRSTITEVDAKASIYATYAIDPKTSGEAPRGILKNSDLIKISIEDKGRDRRTGVLYGVEDSTDGPNEAQREVIGTALGEKLSEELEDTSGTVVTTDEKEGADNETEFKVSDTIDSSGIYSINMIGKGSTLHPMAPRGDGKIVWFGCVDRNSNGDCDDGNERFEDLKDYISLDEDLDSGERSGVRGKVAPWMRVTASVPSDATIDIQFIYYQTSQPEILAGGKKKKDYESSDSKMYPPVFVDDEDKEEPADQDALVLRAGADGDVPSQNLWLKETGDFTGVYEGYLRLTDADGDGSGTGDARSNWGLMVKDATGHGDGSNKEDGMPAVLGVESGPVTITYKNSNGDTRTITILIDKSPPAIQIDSPVHDASSKDDSPDLLGTFTDGGGAGLRANSFKVYADNTDDNDDAKPVWNFRVDGNDDDPYGRVCIVDDDCENNGIVALRGHYSGYQKGDGTFGIIPSMDVYKSTKKAGDEGGPDVYKTASAEDYDDGDTSGMFDSVVRIDFPPDDGDDGNQYNNTIDIQAVVLDIAGNYGFSDSQPSDPTFIHDYGTKEADRDEALHNVLGWYSRHQYRLDDVDPYYQPKQSATGFFTDENGDEQMSSSGLKVVFDGSVDEASVSTATFVVKLDSGSTATITDVDVDKNNVYLLLEETLAPDATPKVDLATGASIMDLAGNEATDRRLEGIELNDGILPTFTITLSGGSGLNEDIDGQGPGELTKDRMTISIESNEDIQGAPKFAVVCSELTWGELSDENDVAKFASNRKGAKTSITDAAPNSNEHGESEEKVRTTCIPEDDGRPYFDIAETSALARPGNRWEFVWANLKGGQELDDGKLSVIVWGRDRSSYHKKDDAGKLQQISNYSSATASFNYDTELKAAWEDAENSELVPKNGEDVFEPRPFVLLDFGDEKTKVDVTRFTIDKVDHTDELQSLEGNEFVWWPEPLAYGKYTVYVEANDGANNQGHHTYSFTVKERAPFTISLLAGWNSISFPANPIDRALHAVFTNSEIDQVVGWNQTEPVSPWRMATRVDGVWTTNDDYATLNDVEARYGYWVHSTGFVTQSVKLSGKGDRATDGQPSPTDIPTDEGWNFVGVVDVDGDQTQDDAGETLRNSNNDPITATEYLGNYTRAYTWDHVNNTWDVVKNDEGITIGTGVWVYYTKDHDIAP